MSHPPSNFDALRNRIGGYQDARLGEMALERGWITDSQLLACQEMIDRGETTLSLPALLQQLKILKPEQVEALLGQVPEAELGGMISRRTTLPPEVQTATADPANRFGKYTLVYELGRGGMGIVHRAWQNDLGRWVALKRLHPEAGPAARQRFIREGQLAARVAHSNLVPIYEVGEQDGHPYLAMALIEGGSVEGKQLPIRRALEIVLEAAQGVDAVHAAGIIHRDIKPANLFADKSGRVVLGDFGLAGDFDPTPGISASGVMLGTLQYAPPEQVRGDRGRMTERSDVYSLGATLWALLAGRPPFDGHDAFEVARQVLETDAPPLRQFVPKIHRDIQTICSRAMAKRPEDRYASAKELGVDLKRYLDGETILARRPGLGERAARFLRNHAISAGVVVLLAAGGIYLVTAKGESDRLHRTQAAYESAQQLYETAKGLQSRGPLSGDEAQKKLVDAETLVIEIGRVDPSHALSRRLHGRIEAMRGDFVAAERRFTEAIALDPAGSPSYYDRGRLRLEFGMSLLMARHPAPETTLCCASRRGLSTSALTGHWVSESGAMAARGHFLGAKEDLLHDPAGRAFVADPAFNAYSAIFSGEISKSRSVCAEALKQPGASLEFRLLYGISSGLLGDDTRALQGFNEVLSQDASNVLALSFRGACRPDAAGSMKDLADALQLRPRDAILLLNRGALRLNGGDSGGALEDLAAADRINPGIQAVQACRVFALERTGRSADALAQADHFLKDARSVALGRWLKANLLMGQFGDRPEIDERVRAEIRAGFAADPGFAPLKLLEAHLFSNEGRNAEALANLNHVLQDPNAPATWLAERGLVYQRLGDVTKALADLDEAIQTCPERADFYAIRAGTHVRAQQWAEARKDCEMALSLDPNLPSTYHNRAIARRHLNDAEGAVDDALKALQGNTLFPEKTQMVLGDAYRDLKKWDAAIQAYTKALESGYPQPGWYASRGLIHLRKRNGANSALDYTEALKGEPDNALWLGNRGRAHAIDGKFEEAVRDFRRAIDLRPALEPDLRRDLELAEKKSGK